MKIKSTHPESQGPYVVINDEDFDPALHVKYDDEPVPANDSPAPVRRGRPPKGE